MPAQPLTTRTSEARTVELNAAPRRRRRWLKLAVAGSVVVGLGGLLAIMHEETSDSRPSAEAESGSRVQASSPGPPEGPRVAASGGGTLAARPGAPANAALVPASARGPGGGSAAEPAAGEPSGGGPRSKGASAGGEAPDGGASPAAVGAAQPAASSGKAPPHAHHHDGGVTGASPGAVAVSTGAGAGESPTAPADADGGVRPTDGGAPAARPAKGASTRVASGPTEGGGGTVGGRAGAARGWVNERTRLDEEDALTRVERFVTEGGSTLSGRVVAADTGKGISGASIHAHSGGSYVETYTDAAGAFRVEGMPARSRATVWVEPVGGYISERIDVPLGGENQTTDAGSIRLWRGDELASRAPGWVGLFVSRRGVQIVVGAVSPWLAADKAGLEDGDEIISIDGHETAGLGPRAATFLLRGAVGTPATLVVRSHAGEKRTLKLDRVPR